MRKPNSNTAVRAPAHCTFAFWNRLVVGGVPIEFVHFQVDQSVLYYHDYGGYGTSRIGEWRIHSMNNAEVINASLSVSSTVYKQGLMRFTEVEI